MFPVILPAMRYGERPTPLHLCWDLISFSLLPVQLLQTCQAETNAILWKTV